MRVCVRLYGVLRALAKAETIQLDLGDTRATVRSVLAMLASEDRFAILKGILDNATTNMLILVSGREINVLDGLDSEVKESDELTLLPVAHGGCG